MKPEPFYDAAKSYEANYTDGPFGTFARQPPGVLPKHPATFLGFAIDLPFGIPAGPLLNTRYIQAAWNWGFAISTYKTVRGSVYPCHPFPNVIRVNAPNQDIHPGETVIGNVDMRQIDITADGITNSFGVPSRSPNIWTADVKGAVEAMTKGNLLILSFMGTKQEGMTLSDYVSDFAKTCKLARDTGAPVLEVNFSCPNVGREGLICNDIETSRAILEALKKAKGNTPLLVKIGYFAPADTTLTQLLTAISENAEGVVGINTIQAKVVDQAGKQILPGSPVRLQSGICGTAIRWAGLDMAHRLADFKNSKAKKDFVVIGVGGVTQPKDYFAYLKTGVDAVQSATGAMWRPTLAMEIRNMAAVARSQKTAPKF